MNFHAEATGKSSALRRNIRSHGGRSVCQAAMLGSQHRWREPVLEGGRAAGEPADCNWSFLEIYNGLVKKWVCPLKKYDQLQTSGGFPTFLGTKPIPRTILEVAACCGLYRFVLRVYFSGGTTSQVGTPNVYQGYGSNSNSNNCTRVSPLFCISQLLFPWVSWMNPKTL